MKTATRILLSLGLLMNLGLSMACDDKGPIEQAAEEVDEAIEDTRAGGETLGNKVDDAVDELREGAKDAKKKMEGN